MTRLTNPPLNLGEVDYAIVEECKDNRIVLKDDCGGCMFVTETMESDYLRIDQATRKRVKWHYDVILGDVHKSSPVSDYIEEYMYAYYYFRLVRGANITVKVAHWSGTLTGQLYTGESNTFNLGEAQFYAAPLDDVTSWVESNDGPSTSMAFLFFQSNQPAQAEVVVTVDSGTVETTSQGGLLMYRNSLAMTNNFLTIEAPDTLPRGRSTPSHDTFSVARCGVPVIGKALSSMRNCFFQWRGSLCTGIFTLTSNARKFFV